MGSTAPGPARSSRTHTSGYESSTMPELTAHLIPALGAQPLSGTGCRARPPRVSLPHGWDSRRAPSGAALKGFLTPAVTFSLGTAKNRDGSIAFMQPISDSLSNSVPDGSRGTARSTHCRATEPLSAFGQSRRSAACGLRLPPRAEREAPTCRTPAS